MNKMTHSYHHKNKTDIWNNSIRNTNLLHPFLCSWSPTALYIAWTFAFKTRATIVQALFLMHNSIYKGKILNNPQIWDFSLLPPTTLNSYYSSAFRSLALQRRAAPYYILQSITYTICEGILERKVWWREICQIQLLEHSHWLRFFSPYFFHCFPAKRNQNKLKCNNKINMALLAFKSNPIKFYKI